MDKIWVGQEPGKTDMPINKHGHAEIYLHVYNSKRSWDQLFHLFLGVHF